MESLKGRLYALLRWSERYTKTDMVYLFSGGFWLSLNTIVPAALGLLLSVALANLLVPESYGLYQYLLSLALLVGALALPGMNVAVAQAVARGYEGTLQAAVRVQLKWAAVPAVLSLAGSAYYFLQGNLDVGFGLAAIAIITPLSCVFNTYVGFLEGKAEFRASFLLGTLINGLSYSSVFVALVWVRDGAALVIINLGVNAAAMCYAYYRTLKAYQANRRSDPEAITYGGHLSVMSSFTTVMNQLDSVLVFHFLGAAQLAVYSLATMLPERIGTLFNFIGTVSLPKLANRSLYDIQQHILGKALRVLLAGAAGTLLYILIAPLAFHILFPKYLSAIKYSMVYAPVIALLALTSLANTTLAAKRRTREIYAVGFVQPLLLVGLQIPLLLLYGLWGMVAARLLSDVIGVCLGLGFILKPLGTNAERSS